MKPETMSEILDYARGEIPREACGLIVNVGGRERFFPCKNIAENQNDFIIDPADYVRAEDSGDILSVVHSHVNIGPAPSQADLVGIERSGLPWHIVAVPVGNWSTTYPTGYVAPLVGREFSHGVLDCYSLIRDWYKEERGIELLDFERSEEWWNKGGDLYVENFGKAGFVTTTEPLESGDVILMQVGSPVINHAAVYLGSGKIIHHLMRRLSCREIYGEFWKRNTRAVIRFKGVT